MCIPGLRTVVTGQMAFLCSLILSNFLIREEGQHSGQRDGPDLNPGSSVYLLADLEQIAHPLHTTATCLCKPRIRALTPQPGRKTKYIIYTRHLEQSLAHNMYSLLMFISVHTNTLLVRRKHEQKLYFYGRKKKYKNTGTA